MATEKELRNSAATWLNDYKGIKEGSTAHKKLISIFNDSGLCSRYKMTTSDPWCALAVSDVFIDLGLTKIFPCVECACENMITLAKSAGIWVEDDSYTPGIGDVILYDWDDSGSGDCTGVADHVGIVQSISGTSMTIIEGNKSDTVGTRSMTVNGRYIRGYITPNYASAASGSTSSDTGATTAADEKTTWNFLYGKIGNAYGTAGLMGNLYAESALLPINLQDSYESKLGYTDKTYTDAVDSGKYTKFSSDSAGYGLAQWTYKTRKKALKSYCDGKGASIGNLTAQLEYLWQELQNDFPSVLSTLKSATSVKTASDAVLTKFEMPADTSSSVKTKRASYGQTYYDKYAGASTATTKSIDEIAQEVIAGQWGNGDARKSALTAAGYDYDKVQDRVNELMGGSSNDKDSNGVCYANKHENGYGAGVKYKVNATSGLNMRYGPSTKHSVMKALTYGSAVMYYGYYDKDSSGTKWMLVIAGGTTGWVCSSYLKKA